MHLADTTCSCLTKAPNYMQLCLTKIAKWNYQIIDQPSLISQLEFPSLHCKKIKKISDTQLHTVRLRIMWILFIHQVVSCHHWNEGKCVILGHFMYGTGMQSKSTSTLFDVANCHGVYEEVQCSFMSWLPFVCVFLSCNNYFKKILYFCLWNIYSCEWNNTHS